MEWFTKKFKKDFILAQRKATGKQVLIYTGKLNNNIEDLMISMWVKYKVHPFWYFQGMYYDLLFDEKLNKI